MLWCLLVAVAATPFETSMTKATELYGRAEWDAALRELTIGARAWRCREIRHERHDAQKRPGLAERIEAGVKDGSLTPFEARRLTQRLENLGPNPDAGEVQQLSRDIFRQRHDPQHTPGE